MGFLKNIKIKIYSKINKKYPNAISVYNNFKTNNQIYYSKHKIKSVLFLKKLISCERKGKNLLDINFPKNTFKHNQSSSELNIKNEQQLSEVELVQKLLNYDVISFDIFDTCIFRKLNKPTDLFDNLEKKFKIENFKKIRIKAEIDARANIEISNGEIDIYDIYHEIEKANINIKDGAESEIEEELNVCYANPYMLEVFSLLKKQNKTIIAISDMYLPKETIAKILYNNKFIGFDNIFVSNEYKCNKSNGNLFKIAKKFYKDKKIIHLGDNYLADVKGAKKAKVDSFHYQK